MELPDLVFDEFDSTVLKPGSLHSRFENLSANVWTWGKQMTSNSEHEEALSPATRMASSAVALVINQLGHVLCAFKTGTITYSSVEQIEQDVEDFENFVSVICGEGEAKLKLKGLGDQIVMVFPEGAPFFPGPTVNKLYCETAINDKVNRLLDQQLKNTFQVALNLFLATSQDFWPDGRKKTLNKTLVDDWDRSLVRQKEMKARIQELEEVRCDLFLRELNERCRDPRVKSSSKNKTTVRAAIEETAKENKQLEFEFRMFSLQSRFYQQIRSHYGLAFEAGDIVAE